MTTATALIDQDATFDFSRMDELQRIVTDCLDTVDDFDIDAIMDDLRENITYNHHTYTYTWTGTQDAWWDTIAAHVITD